MSGLRRIAKRYGAIIVDGERYVWDYAADEPVSEEDMPVGSERWKRSEQARWEDLKESEGE